MSVQGVLERVHVKILAPIAIHLSCGLSRSLRLPPAASNQMEQHIRQRSAEQCNKTELNKAQKQRKTKQNKQVKTADNKAKTTQHELAMFLYPAIMEI